MDIAVSIIGLVAVLFLVARGTPGRTLLVVSAVTLAVVVALLAIEQAGWWPKGWRVR